MYKMDEIIEEFDGVKKYVIMEELVKRGASIEIVEQAIDHFRIDLEDMNISLYVSHLLPDNIPLAKYLMEEAGYEWSDFDNEYDGHYYVYEPLSKLPDQTLDMIIDEFKIPIESNMCAIVFMAIVRGDIDFGAQTQGRAQHFVDKFNLIPERVKKYKHLDAIESILWFAMYRNNSFSKSSQINEQQLNAMQWWVDTFELTSEDIREVDLKAINPNLHLWEEPLVKCASKFD